MEQEQIVLMPQLGESVHEARIVRWLVVIGQDIEEFQSLVEVETDKVTAEVPAPFSGKVARLIAPEGAVVAVGGALAALTGLSGAPGQGMRSAMPAEDAPDDGKNALKEAPIADQQSTQSASSRKAMPDAIELELIEPSPYSRHRLASPEAPATNDSAQSTFVSPAVRRLAERHQVTLGAVQGTGTAGRISKKDVLNFLSGNLGHRLDEVPGPSADIVEAGRTRPSLRLAKTSRAGELLPHSRLRKQIADRMLESKLSIPHAWQTQEVDMSRIVAARKAVRSNFKQRTGVDLTYLPFVVKAAGAALKSNPKVNSTYTPEGLILHKEINVAISVALEDGVMLPVVRSVDGKSIQGLAVEISDLTARARSGQLKPDEVGGASLTINNSGTFGTVLSYSIIPIGQVGILTMEVVRTRPVMIDDVLAFKPMMYLCFSLDHRVMDGLAASRFLSGCRESLESFDEHSI